MQATNVIVGVSQIRLHYDAEVRVVYELGIEDRVFEGAMYQVLVPVLLHVKVNEGAAFFGQPQQGAKAGASDLAHVVRAAGSRWAQSADSLTEMLTGGTPPPRAVR